MMGWYDGPGWAGWAMMTVSMLAFWALLVLGGLAVWRSLGRDAQGRTNPGEAERLLDERLARGEIDEDDYTRRRGLLRSGR
jgi:putative membrane protein